MKIGIPLALIYWKRPFFWEKFFTALGFEVILSPKTNKEIVEIGVQISDPETCFSNKVYFGHLKWLEDKADFIFVPRLKRNEEGLEYCPKFFALPDLAKIFLKTKILTLEVDGKNKTFRESLFSLGKRLKKKREEIEKSYYQTLLEEKILKDKEKEIFFQKISSRGKKIFLISHPYNLYDDYVNLRIRERLEKLGVIPIFIEEVPFFKLKPFRLKHKFHWEFAQEMLGKLEEIFNFKIDGAIQISSFACGCDAVIKEFVEKRIKEEKIPFLYLIIDEHTGEAGFQTRIEAFVDTLK